MDNITTSNIMTFNIMTLISTEFTTNLDNIYTSLISQEPGSFCYALSPFSQMEQENNLKEEDGKKLAIIVPKDTK